MARHNTIGNEGEELAKKYLVEAGYKIIATNFRYKRAEIDLIAEKEKRIIFVEVKTRSGNAFGEPEAFVSKKKASLIIDAADHFIYMNNWLFDIRFDIISVAVNPEVKIYHFEDAFY